MIVVILPVKVVSEMNMRQHWSLKARRTSAQRDAVWLACRQKLRAHPLPAVVTLVRIAPRELDDDNLRGAFKGVRDSVTKCLGLIEDRDPRVAWRYEQRRGKPKVYGIEIRIEEGART